MKIYNSILGTYWKGGLSYLRFEKPLPDLRVDPRLEPGGDGGPGDDEEDEGGAGGLVVGAEEHHHHGHQLHAPRDQVEGAVVRGRPHAVDHGEADQPGRQDVADHQVEVLLGQGVISAKSVWEQSVGGKKSL